MQVRINQLVKTIFQKDTLEQCSLQELQQYADRHSYFGAAQLLLTKKMQLEQHEQFDKQLQKTFLYFHNPLWVQHVLNDNGKAEIIPPVSSVENTMSGMATPAIEEKKDEPAEIIAEATITEEISIAENSDSLPEVEIIAADNTIIAEEPKEEPVNTEQTQPAFTIKPLKEEAAELLFQPYHTVDYFASQGIKFKEENKPEGKFDQQLKSFTGWLKTLKTMPVSEIAKNVDARSEQKVEKLAETSLENREVITDTMAEVWEKQGNYPKAIEIYNKLSLLEPSKNAYFAAKIEDLKKLL